MAITRETITKDAGWTSADVINQLEEAFAFAGLHGGPVTGLAGGYGYISDPTTFGGTIGSMTQATAYRDIEPISTSGSGVGATFNVERNSIGKINFIRVNRPGKGYSDLDTVTLHADSIGGLVNGATNITFPIFVDSVVTGANIYDFSYTGVYILSGTDRLGSYSNVPETTPLTITIMEGDTLRISNSMSSGRTIYILLENGKFGDSSSAPLFAMGYSGGSTSTTLIWDTKPGQAGTYYLAGASSVSSLSMAHNIVVLPADGTRTFSPKSYGSSSTFFDKQASGPGSLFPWGCLRTEVQENKKYGSTYRTFQVSNPGKIEFCVGSSFMPRNAIRNSFSSRFKGSRYLDLSLYIDTNNTIMFDENFLYSYNTATPPSSGQISTFSLATPGGGSGAGEINRISNSNAGNSFALDLNVYRSSEDPNFSVFSYRQSTLSSTHLTGNSFLTFFLHNFTSSIWDLDSVFLGGVTVIEAASGNTTQPRLIFRTFCAGAKEDNRYPSWRCAEAGYLSSGDSTSTDKYLLTLGGRKETIYYANTYTSRDNTGTTGQNVGIYYRTNSSANPFRDRGVGLSDDSNFNAIIRGIPLSLQLVPVPYYLPDDFVILQFENSTPALNIQQGDLVIVEDGVEEYVIITGSYNQTVSTIGILFCARVV